MALVLMSTLLFAALAVDTGRLVMEKRRLQRIADLSALHAADVSACSGTITPDYATVAAAAQESAKANGYSGDLRAEGGAVTLGSTVTAKDGTRSFSVNRTAENTAVRVVATSAYPTSLILPSFFGGNIQLQAMAVATKQIMTGIQLGSFLTRINTGQSILNGLLGGLLGTNVSLGLLEYKGIAAAQVTLLNLIEGNANVGTVDELLKANLSVGEFLDVLVSAVDQNSTAAIALNQLALSIGPLPTIKLGDILEVSGTNPEAALDAKVNVFDLLVAGLQLANKEHAISVPGISVNLGSLAQVGLSLYVIEPPKIAIGPPGRDSNGDWWTETETAQLRLQLDIAVDLFVAKVDLGIFLDAAKARAHVEAVQCATGKDPEHHVTIGVQPSIVSLGIGHYVNSHNIEPSKIYVGIPGLINLLGLDVTADVQVREPNQETLAFDVGSLPIPNPPPPELTATVGTRLGAALANAVSGLAQTLHFEPSNTYGGGLLGSLLAGVLELAKDIAAGLLGPLLELVAAILLDPLLTALGIQFGGADVSLIWLKIEPTLLAI